MTTKEITIDLTVSRIIEMHRTSFSEKENDILQRILSSIEKQPPSKSGVINIQQSATPIQLENPQSQLAEFFISSSAHKKDVYAWGNKTANGFLVLKGSRVSKYTTPKMPDYYLSLRKRLILEKVIDFDSRLFTRDYEFSAASAASSVILGVSSDGIRDWIPQIHVSNYDLD